MEIKPGSIYWLKTESKFAHPYVIVKINEDNSLLVCGITTNMKKLNTPKIIVLEAGEGNLPKQSIIETYNTLTINKTQLGEFIGTLSEERVKQVINLLSLS